MPIDFDKIKSGIKKGFEKGMETAREGIEIAVDKSSEAIEIQKIKSQISGLHNKIKQSYNDLGRKVYELKDTEIANLPELKGFFMEINKFYSDIDTKEKDIEKIKDGTDKQILAQDIDVVDFDAVEVLDESDTENNEENINNNNSADNM